MMLVLSTRYGSVDSAIRWEALRLKFWLYYYLVLNWASRVVCRADGRVVFRCCGVFMYLLLLLRRPRLCGW